ncbi:hypothetical protein ANO11243_045080 [Dothideomycetidae sp. 11243]|nr:hypothetical protein ANO11243_045080 [fungal sp. No.11243]
MRRANEAYAKSEAGKRGKPTTEIKKNVKGVQKKAPISQGWVLVLLFVVCGGIIFELARIVFGASRGWFS